MSQYNGPSTFLFISYFLIRIIKDYISNIKYKLVKMLLQNNLYKVHFYI